MQTLITIKSQSDSPVLFIVEAECVRTALLYAMQLMTKHNIPEIDLQYNGFTFNIETSDIKLSKLTEKIDEYNEWKTGKNAV